MYQAESPTRATPRGVKIAAWQEFREAQDYGGRLGDTARGMDYPPSGFVAVELGFAWGERPSLWETLRRIDDVGKAPQRKSTAPRMTGARAQRLARRLVKAARKDA